jgi:hypothetical protein
MSNVSFGGKFGYARLASQLTQHVEGTSIRTVGEQAEASVGRGT